MYVGSEIFEIELQRRADQHAATEGTVLRSYLRDNLQGVILPSSQAGRSRGGRTQLSATLRMGN